MKAVLLAGGLGSRLSEETDSRPKPMVEIGGKPILWHIMKMYSAHGINDFVVCLGYKGHVIKEYFANYFLHTADVTLDLVKNSVEVHQTSVDPWKITLVDTGAETMTGGRLKRVAKYLGDETFCMTYGDGVADVDIGASIAFHKAHGKLATVTAVPPLGRFGVLHLDGDRVSDFHEKPMTDGEYINGGFFVLEPGAIETVDGDPTVWEKEPMDRLFKAGELFAYRHHGFWHPMDTLRDRRHLEDLWASGAAPWKHWA
ncbi:MAG: glucose-1-phosphate cytidylyltransferase [Magnetospirillum sp.]|nr:glucose-1-phosphate cytidylyltransferase [Magnetospirillum sp.]